MVNLSTLGQSIRQTFLTHDTSFPYLSGDTFKLSADFQFSSLEDFQSQRNWEEKKVVFCKSDSLGLFLSEKPSQLNPRVLLCGNSDFDFHSIDSSGLGGIKALFLQNSFISDSKMIFTLPIGLENARYESNGRVSLYSKKLRNEKLNSVLVGPFGNTHTERNQLNSLESDRFLYCVKERVSTPRHLSNVDSHNFVACPRGNGVDTHRVWESLYRGSIPVLVRNSWSESLKNFGFPVKIIDDWGEIRSVPNESTILSPSQVRNHPFLWMRTWEKMFLDFM